MLHMSQRTTSGQESPTREARKAICDQESSRFASPLSFFAKRVNYLKPQLKTRCSTQYTATVPA